MAKQFMPTTRPTILNPTPSPHISSAPSLPSKKTKSIMPPRKHRPSCSPSRPWLGSCAPLSPPASSKPVKTTSKDQAALHYHGSQAHGPPLKQKSPFAEAKGH